MGRLASPSTPTTRRLRICGFEQERNATKLRQALSREFPWPRLARLLKGDSNDTIHQALADLRAALRRPGSNFRLYRPERTALHLEHLAGVGADKGPKAKTKVELWMLFPDPLFARLLPRTGEVRPADNVAITAMFGDPL